MGFAALIAVAAVAQDGPLKTAGLTNGRVWLTMTQNERAYYILGFVDGSVRAPQVDRNFDCACTVEEIRSAINEFYIDSTNRQMPIIFAWKLVVMKMNGATAASVDVERSKLLAYFNAH